MTPDARTRLLRKRLDELRTELADLAFELERRGRLDAADLATSVSGRVGEVCAEITNPTPIAPPWRWRIASTVSRRGLGPTSE